MAVINSICARYFIGKMSLVCLLHLLLSHCRSIIKGVFSNRLFHTDGETFTEEIAIERPTAGDTTIRIRSGIRCRERFAWYIGADRPTKRQVHCSWRLSYFIAFARPPLCSSVLFPVIIWSALLTCHPSVYCPRSTCQWNRCAIIFLFPSQHWSSKSLLQSFLQTFRIFSTRLAANIWSLVFLDCIVTKLDNFTRRNVRKCSHDETSFLSARKLLDKLT